MDHIIVSDLHTEIHEGFRLPLSKNEKEKNLILAGDICNIKYLEASVDFFIDVCTRFRNVYYVFGNHEFYDSQMDEALAAFSAFKMSKKELKNLDWSSYGKAVADGDITYIMATLWTDFNHPDEVIAVSNGHSKGHCQRVMSDFRRIRGPSGHIFSPNESVIVHNKQLAFISKALKEKLTEKAVVITHHAPTVRSISPKFWRDPLNPAFSSNLVNFINEHKPDLWVHGHMHDSFNYMIGRTNVICNPHGYYNENELGFDPILSIKL